MREKKKREKEEKKGDHRRELFTSDNTKGDHRRELLTSDNTKGDHLLVEHLDGFHHLGRGILAGYYRHLDLCAIPPHVRPNLVTARSKSGIQTGVYYPFLPPSTSPTST